MQEIRGSDPPVVTVICDPNKISSTTPSQFETWLEVEVSQQNLLFAERFIRTLKNKIYKYMTSISKNVYVDKLNDIVNKYNNTYHRIIKMKPVNVKQNTYIDSSKENNDKYPKFKIAYIVRISKYKNIFVKGCTPNWSEEVFCD